MRAFHYLLFSPATAGRGLPEGQDAKTSKSPTKSSFLLNFLPPLIFYFLKKNKNAKPRIQKELQIFCPQSLYPDFRLAFCFDFTMFFFRSFKFNELMHRPLGRAAFVVFAPFALAGARAHSTLAWSLA